jgi:hypothetical protein
MRRQPAFDGTVPVVAAGRKAFPSRRAALTLVELTLTLVVLAAIAIIVWPTLSGAFEGIRLSKAADLVRAELGAARVKAMTTGETHAFRYELSTGIFQVERWSGPDASLEAADATELVDQGIAETMPVAAEQRTLPEGIVFLAGEVATDARLLTNTFGTAAQEPAQVHSTILLYPDGSTTTASILLVDQQGDQIVVELRGMTGVALAGPVTSSPDGAAVNP